MSGGEAPFLPMSSGSELDTKWSCPECTHIELGKSDWPLGAGQCKEHSRLLIRNQQDG